MPTDYTPGTFNPPLGTMRCFNLGEATRSWRQGLDVPSRGGFNGAAARAAEQWQLPSGTHTIGVLASGGYEFKIVQVTRTTATSAVLVEGGVQ
jgi:hypothetical protein